MFIHILYLLKVLFKKNICTIKQNKISHRKFILVDSDNA